MEKFKKFGIIFACISLLSLLITGISLITVITFVLTIDMATSFLRTKTYNIVERIDKTKVIWNKIIPFGSYCTIMLFGIIFSKHTEPKTKEEQEKFELSHLKHEYIHKAQLLETGYLVYYILYCIEFLTYLLVTFNWKASYKNISFEREANIKSIDYKNRDIYGWTKYWFDFENLNFLIEIK